MDGKIFNVDELKVGVTAPPFHPNCGRTMVPYFESEEEQQDEEDEEKNTAPTKNRIICSNEYLTIEEVQINATYIYNYLIENGWTKNATCGLFGNMQIESTMNPGCWQLEYDVGDENAGFGLTQWTPASKLFDWAEKNNLDPYDIDTQLYRILLEASNGTGEYYQWNSSKHSSGMTFEEFTQCDYLSCEELAEIFMWCYEQPEDPEFLRNPEDPNSDSRHLRMNNAKYWYNYFNNQEKEE